MWIYLITVTLSFLISLSFVGVYSKVSGVFTTSEDGSNTSTMILGL